MDKELKIKTNKLIHSASVKIVEALNLGTSDIASLLNIAYHTAFKKKNNTHKLGFTESDFDTLIEYMDNAIDKSMSARKESRELKDNLKFMQKSLHN